MCEYNQRLKIERDNYSVMKYAKEEAHKIGLEKGLEKGRIEERKEMALKLKAANAAFDLISETTGLTIEEIVSL